MPTHYEVLGVAATASAEELRRAYREKARLLHPDLSQGAGPSEAASAARAMQLVNQAWGVLRDPAARATYDAGLALDRRRAGGSGPVGPEFDVGADPDVDLDDRPYHHAPAEPGDLGLSIVRSLPWVAILVVLAAIFVFTAFAGGERTPTSASDLVGRCVEVGAQSRPTPVPCGAGTARVELVTSSRTQCPPDSTAAAMPGEEEWLCLRPADRTGESRPGGVG